MSLIITERPRLWSHIVGQDRAVTVLQSILKQGRFIPRGVLFEGPYGVGKTSLAQIYARAIMCTTSNLGCGKCPSCMTFDDDPDLHPDFLVIDAASHSGVDKSREILAQHDAVPVVGARRVLYIDEVHRLSKEASDTYLKPLERASDQLVFLLSTTEGTRVSKTVRSRCSKIRMGLVDNETIVGLLCAIAAKHEIQYELDGLKLIARAAKGHVRDAVSLFDTVAAIGPVTRELVGTYAEAELEDMALKVLYLISFGKVKDAIPHILQIGRMTEPQKVVQLLFSWYGRAVFSDSSVADADVSVLKQIASRLNNPAAATAIFLKWSGAMTLPVDALPVFAAELGAIAGAAWPQSQLPEASASASAAPKTASAQKPAPSVGVSPKALAEALGGTFERI